MYFPIFFLVLVYNLAEVIASAQQLTLIHEEIPENIRKEFHANITRKSIQSRIRDGGLFAKPDQFPYASWLHIYVNARTRSCGGSLITRNFVLTAAHCVDGSVEGIDVHLGSIDRSAFPTKIAADAYAFNYEYNRKTFENDIGLVRLKLSVLHSVAILPTGQIAQMTFQNNQGYTVRVAGWGQTETGSMSQFLKYADLQTLSFGSCFVPSENIICTQKGIYGDDIAGPGVGLGDSGGPLLYNGVLVGIVSFEVRYVDEYVHVYNGFIRIAPYLDWIRSYIGPFMYAL